MTVALDRESATINEDFRITFEIEFFSAFRALPWLLRQSSYALLA